MSDSSSSNPPIDRCEHGIPRQFCTALHFKPLPVRRCRLCDEFVEASSPRDLCQACITGHDAGGGVWHAGRADLCLTCEANGGAR